MPTTLKQSIINYSKTINIDKIRFTTADPFITLKQRLITQQQNNYQSSFEEPDLEKRTNPKKLLPECKSIIAIALAYPSKMKNPPTSTKKDSRGIFCRASWGEDYHVVLREKLNLLEQFILSHEPTASVKSMVDTGALVDRAVAERAGIGWSGKNCAIITPEFGSYVYLGEMITSISFEPDLKIENQCGECTKCIDACPTGALVQGGQIDAKRCIAYLTQTKDLIPDEFRAKIGNRLYGCDTCQVVCPENKGKDFHHHVAFEPNPEHVKPILRSLLYKSNREFKEMYGYMSGAWRGKNPIQRNAILAIAHFKDKSALGDLEKLLHEDERPLIRGTAAFAIGKIGGNESQAILVETKNKEQNELVQAEIKKALKKWNK